jgi:hypothetical protein
MLRGANFRGRETSMIGYVIVLVIGLVILVKFARDILLGRRSRGWPKTSGTILQSTLETHHETDDDGTTSTTHGVAVHYRYSVSGQEFEGRRRSFSDVRKSSKRSMESILARYPQGGSIDVYYDPENPSSAVLETGVGASAYILLAFAVVLVLFGLAGLLGFVG